MSEKYTSAIMEVKRFGDRLMTIALVVGSQSLNVICGYAPHVGLRDSEKKEF